MSMRTTEGHPKSVTLELMARYHAGVMSQVCGLLARRAYPTDGLLCLPLADGHHCRFWLRVPDDARLPNLIAQLRKLEDIHDVQHGLTWQPQQTLAQLATWFHEGSGNILTDNTALVPRAVNTCPVPKR